MKLASLPTSGLSHRDGDLVLVSRDGLRAVKPNIPGVVCLREAVEQWDTVQPQLELLARTFENGTCANTFAFPAAKALAPLPRCPGFYDGSSFLSHVVRARKARGDEPPATLKTIPLMYQGVSDGLLGGQSPLEILDPHFGADFEGEFGVVVGDVPRGISPQEALYFIRLVVLLNDITLREVLKKEIEFKFGFLQSKPNSSFAPLAVTLDELGEAWQGGRVHLDLQVTWNSTPFGHPHGKEMFFHFGELIAHAARTRPLSAGSIVGSGTVSNEDAGRGFACLTEKRCHEIIHDGAARTRWLAPDDRVQMFVMHNGFSVFGALDQTACLTAQ